MQCSFALARKKMNWVVTPLAPIVGACQVFVRGEGCGRAVTYFICFDKEGKEKFGERCLYCCYYHFIALKLARPAKTHCLNSPVDYIMPDVFKDSSIDTLQKYSSLPCLSSLASVCSIIDYSGPCQRRSGISYFGKMHQFIVHRRRLHYTLKSEALHIFICNYHDTMIKMIPMAIKYEISDPEESSVIEACAALINLKQNKHRPRNYKCCLIDFEGKCERTCGNAYFGRKYQIRVAQSKLCMKMDPKAVHIYICPYHETSIRVAYLAREFEYYWDVFYSK